MFGGNNSFMSFGTAKEWVDTFSFDDALGAHAMLRNALQRVKEHQFGKEKNKRIGEGARDAWDQCMGVGDPDSDVACAVRSVMPLSFVPLLRMRSGIPAAYFVVHLIDTFASALQHGQDIDDDMVLRRVIQRAFDEFDKRRKTADKLKEGFGFDDSDSWAQMRKMNELEERSGYVTPLMQQIADLAGRMYKAFQYNAIPSKCPDPQEVEGVEVGGDLSRMLDDDAAAMGVDPEVLAAVAEERANQYQMSGESIKSRGPLVIVIDESGSMHGNREVWAKACAVALTRVALQEGRAVRCVHFATGTHTHDVNPGNADDMRLVAESHLSGGTDIDVALQVAIRQVGNLAKDDKVGADIVFITDGLDRYSEKHFKTMVREGIQLWTVAIDIDIKAVAEQSRQYRGSYAASGWLYTYARAYVHVDDTMLNNGGKAIEAALQLRDSALDNATREREAQEAEGRME